MREVRYTSAMTYTPTRFLSADGSRARVVTTWAGHYQALWDGYVLEDGAPVQIPTLPASSQESIEDVVGAMLRGGANVSVAYDDDTGLITISAGDGLGDGTSPVAGAVYVRRSAANGWPARPTSDPAVVVHWIGGTPSTPPTSRALAGVDLWHVPETD